MHEIEWNDEQIAHLWNYYSKTCPYKDEYFAKVMGQNIITHVKRHINLSGARLLDFGSGPGYILQHIINSGIKLKYNALDFSKESIENLKNKFQNSNHLETAGVIEQLPSPFRDGFFDVIFCIELIEHLRDEYLSATIKEVKRLLKPGGFVVITTPNKEDLNISKLYCPECGCIFHKWQHLRSWSKESLSEYLESLGLRTVIAKEVLFHPVEHLFKTIARVLYCKIANKKAPHLLYIGRS